MRLLPFLLPLHACQPSGQADSASDSGQGHQTDPSCAQVQSDPGMSWEGHPLDGWAWQKEGALFADGDAGAGEGDLAPALLRVDGALWLYFARARGISHTLWRATSQDEGATWSEPCQVSGLPVSSALYTSVGQEAAQLRMWIAGGSLDVYTSSDGLVWSLQTEAALLPGSSGAFDVMSLIYPAVLADESGYRLWYTGFDGAQYRIGLASSADGLQWSRADANPLLARGGEGDFDNASVAQPVVQPVGEGFGMWYGGYDTSNTDPGPWRVGFATSTDGQLWQKVGVSLPLGEEGSDAWSTRDPAVISSGAGWLMVYVGMGEDAVYRLHLARSAVCAE